VRILLMSNAPWASSGFGGQTKGLVAGLRALGHEVAVFAFWGLKGGILELDGVRIYPGELEPYGQDILPYHIEHFKADLLITLVDLWVLDKVGALAKKHGWPWLAYTPVDSVPAPKKLVEYAEGARFVVADSQFGAKMMREAGLGNVRYAPHAVTSAFRPGDQGAARRKHNIPEGAFVIGMVAANRFMPSRKAFPEQLQAFAKFHERHPEAVLYLHTFMLDSYRGVDLLGLVQDLGLAEAVLWSDQYAYTVGYPEAEMVELYQSFDLLSAASLGEGFGLPILEAQACGVPVVTTKWSSMPELTWAGASVGGQRFLKTDGTFWMLPSIDGIAAAYEEMFRRLHDEKRTAELREIAVTQAAAYQWENVMAQYWAPLLAEVATGMAAEAVVKALLGPEEVEVRNG